MLFQSFDPKRPCTASLFDLGKRSLDPDLDLDLRPLSDLSLDLDLRPLDRSLDLDLRPLDRSLDRDRDLFCFSP